MGALFSLIVIGLFWGFYSLFGAGSFLKKSNREINYISIRSKISIYYWDAQKFVTKKNIKDVKEDLIEIFGEEWDRVKSKIKIGGDSYAIGCGNGFYNVTNLVNEIIIAKHGYIEYSRVCYDLKSVIYGIDRGKQFDIAMRACKVIEKYMQQAHPDLNLRLELRSFAKGKLCMCWNFYYDTLI